MLCHCLSILGGILLELVYREKGGFAMLNSQIKRARLILISRRQRSHFQLNWHTLELLNGNGGLLGFDGCCLLFFRARATCKSDFFVGRWCLILDFLHGGRMNSVMAEGLGFSQGSHMRDLEVQSHHGLLVWNLLQNNSISKRDLLLSVNPPWCCTYPFWIWTLKLGNWSISSLNIATARTFS